MVPDKFNMVDMGGIDLIESQGVAVEGLYQKLVESIALCRYQCLYNWKFNRILIPPSYVEMEVQEDGVWINEGVMVDEEDVIHIYSIEPEPPAPVVPEIQPLAVTENGDYYTPVGVDGYNPVSVNVPSQEPVIEGITITQNGTVTAPSGVDGYSPIIVDVPTSVAGLDEIWSGSFIGSINGIEAINSGVTISDSKFVFATSAYLVAPLCFYGCKFQVDTDNLGLAVSSTNRRFITLLHNSSWGLIFRSTGEWGIYMGSWIMSGIHDPNYFDDCIVEVRVSSDGVWSIYKNDVFVFNSGSYKNPLPDSFVLGSRDGSSILGSIKSFKVF